MTTRPIGNRFTTMIVDENDDDKHKYKGYGHILAIGRDNPSPFFFPIPVLTRFLSSLILLFTSRSLIASPQNNDTIRSLQFKFKFEATNRNELIWHRRNRGIEQKQRIEGSERTQHRKRSHATASKLKSKLKRTQHLKVAKRHD